MGRTPTTNLCRFKG